MSYLVLKFGAGGSNKVSKRTVTAEMRSLGYDWTSLWERTLMIEISNRQ